MAYRARTAAMIAAEKRIEEWRRELLRGLPPRIDIAIYLLVVTAAASIAHAANRLMPERVAELELLVRDRLQALQFSLQGLGGPLPEERFNEEAAVRSLDPNQITHALDILTKMSTYVTARDAYLTYKWGGYEVDGPAEHLRFRDIEGWQGARDRAQHLMRNEIELELAKSFVPSRETLASTPPLESVDIPPDLFLEGISAEKLVSVVRMLKMGLFEAFMLGSTPLRTRADLAADVRRGADLTQAEADRVVDIFTLRRHEATLTLFHCPLVPVTASEVLVVAAGSMFCNAASCIPRLF